MSRVLNAIVAVCPDLGIGKNGNLPWHPVRLNNEFKHFRKMTATSSVKGKQNVVIMGRKTWFSIPAKNRPLPDRINIVLSRECNHLPESGMFSKTEVGGCHFTLGIPPQLLEMPPSHICSREPPAGAHYLASDFSSALRLVDIELADQADQVWIIGGSSLYKEMMESSVPRRLFVTRILKQFECDTFLTEICLDKYRLLSAFPEVPQELQEENGIQYKFEVYESM